MTIIVAGSRTITDGQDSGGSEKAVLRRAAGAANLRLLDKVICDSGFHTSVVNLHHYKGPCIRVDRSSEFGNPFTHLPGNTRAQFRVATREEAVGCYPDWFLDQPHLHDRLGELRGRRLGCWCTPALCHADYLAELAGRITCVVDGGAPGVDRIGRLWIRQQGHDTIPMPADWEKNGRAVGMIRNRAMAELPVVNGAVILISGNSPGSQNMIAAMDRVHKPCYVQKVTVDEHGRATENGPGTLI